MSDVTIAAKNHSRTIHGWLTDDAPTVTAGYGGWQTQPRPRKASLTVWQGRDPFQLTVPMLLFQAGHSVQGDIHDIDVLSSGTSKGEPPIVTIDGAVMVPAHAGNDWVIQDVSWGDQVRRGDRVIIRQLVTVTLLEYVDDALLAASTAADHRGRVTVVRHYRVKQGDTLRSIAAHELDDQKRWVDIAALNGLRSSGTLKRGQLLKLP